MKKSLSLFLFVLIFAAAFSFGQSTTSPIPEVSQDVYHDTSPPLREMQEAPLYPTPWEGGIIPLMLNESRFGDQYQYDPGLQDFDGSNGLSIITQSWNGVGASGYAPPDNSGDVGPNHYMHMVNVRFQIWNKTGTSLLGPLNLGTIWSGFPGPWSTSLNDGDPIVLYDEVADRWFVAQFSLPNFPNGPFYILAAVSQTNDPTGSWHRYGFTFTHMPDYPKFGIWPDGYYMSANSFSSGSLNFNGTYVAAFERSQMLTGSTAQMVSFLNSPATTWSLLPSDYDGGTPPGGAPNYFGQIHDNAFYGGSDGFDIFQFAVNWVSPGSSTFTGPTFISTNAFVGVNGIPQLGTGTLLDDLDQMTMNRLNYRNFGSHQSMVTCHTVDAGSSRAGMRWYEFRNTGSGWSLYQQGTYAPADGHERWMGSIAINSNGDICLGYSVSSSTIYPQIRFTGRLSSDPLGQMTVTEETIHSGSGAQTSLTRWGDYTQMAVDPSLPRVFWYVNQYQPSSGSFNWQTRIAALDFALVPVELTSFTATAVNNDVELNWVTATETNNQGFEIERSAGQSWEKIGYVAGFGTTTETKTYSFTDNKLDAGSYSYRLKQIDLDGSYSYSKEVNVEVSAPVVYALEQNYPNPFNPATTIRYSIPEDGFVKLAVYNTLGEEVATLVNNIQHAGVYDVQFDAASLSSGVYVYKIEAAGFVASRKLVLTK